MGPRLLVTGANTGSRRDSDSGVRDFEAASRLAATYGMEMLRDIAMPFHNRILLWIAKVSNI